MSAGLDFRQDGLEMPWTPSNNPSLMIGLLMACLVVVSPNLIQH